MKRVICLMLCAVLTLSMCACGKSAPVDVQGQADAFVTNCTFDASMEPVDAEELSFYFDVPEGAELAGYMADGTSTEIVVCAACKSESDAQALCQSFQDYLDSQVEEAVRYLPEEVERLNDGGRTWCYKTNVILLVCTDNATVDSILEGFAS